MVTINEIAKRAKVSVGTVDRVIHNRGRVSKETAKRVRQIIEELDYKPNILARSLSRLKTFQFGVLMPKISHDNHYWELAIKGIKKAQNELRIHKVNVKYFQYEGYSETSFKRVSGEVLQADLDALLMAPIIYKTFDDEFVKNIPANLPYAFFNSNIPNSNNLSYIGQDSFQSGIVAGNLMQMIVKQNGTIAVLSILPKDYHITERLTGFQSYIEHNSDLKIKIYGAHRSEDKLTFDRLLKRIFSENEDLQGIFVTTALTYRVAEFIKSQSIQKKIYVIGYDLTDQNVLYLKQGLIDFLISQRPETQGYQGIYKLYEHVVLNEQVDKQTLMPIDIVTKTNIDFYQSQYYAE